MQGLEQLYKDVAKYNKLFKAKTYVDAVDEFYDKYSKIFYGMNQSVEDAVRGIEIPEVETECLPDEKQETSVISKPEEKEKLEKPTINKLPEPIQEVVNQVAGEFLDGSEAILKKNGKQPRGREMMDINIYMVMYVFPGIIATNRIYARNIAETVAEGWRDRFKNSMLSCSDYDTINAGFRRRFCYITTAVCESLGKAEDCMELDLLRSFRDGYMLTTQGGGSMVDEYYNIAPAIVSAINNIEDRDEVYRKIYNEYILPCITMIESDQMKECMEHYKRMVEYLT